MNNTIDGLDTAQQLLVKLVDENPNDWGIRKKVVNVLYDSGFFLDASKMLWSAPEIPPTSEELVFAIMVVSKGQPSRALRLLDVILTKNETNPAENLHMAKLLMKRGLIYQSIRFYGATTANDKSMADSEFEMYLLNVDAERFSWQKAVMDKDFPWDAPEVELGGQPPAARDGNLSVEVAKSDELSGLLSGATMPVPLKFSPATAEIPTHNVAENSTEKAIVPPPTILATPESISTAGDTSKVSTMGDTTQVSTVSDTSSEVKAEAPRTVLLKENQEKVAEPIVSNDSKPITESTQEVESKDETIAAKDSVSGETALQSTQSAVASPAEAPTTLVVPPVTSAKPAESKQVAESPSETANAAVDKPEATATDTQKALPTPQLPTDHAPEPSPEEPTTANAKGGMFSSLFGKLRGQPKPAENVGKDDVINVDNLDLSGVQPAAAAPNTVAKSSNNEGAKLKPQVDSQGAKDSVIEPSVTPEASKKPASSARESEAVTVKSTTPNPIVASAATPTPEPEPVVVPAASPTVRLAAGIASRVERPVEDDNAEPHELDGRTQLVTLAPEDGDLFFNELIEKYRALENGPLPETASIARNMSGIDYLDLINKACQKDLGAFSKLLGLHRVMTEAHCQGWADDMNILRKGYGDAVLATVVSKYSVAECREILNSVYSFPSSPKPAAS